MPGCFSGRIEPAFAYTDGCSLTTGGHVYPWRVACRFQESKWIRGYRSDADHRCGRSHEAVRAYSVEHNAIRVEGLAGNVLALTAVLLVVVGILQLSLAPQGSTEFHK